MFLGLNTVHRRDVLKNALNMHLENIRLSEAFGDVSPELQASWDRIKATIHSMLREIEAAEQFDQHTTPPNNGACL